MSNYGSPYILGRFLSGDDIRDKNQRVHRNAFDQRVDQNYQVPILAVSCFEVQELSSADVFQIADNGASPITLDKKPPTAYCNIHEHEFPKDKLQLDFNDTPPRHVNIIGWPQEKEKRKEFASILAEIASNEIILRP